ncbi:hypothetical protein [Lacipirellula parvula]|uniref:Uncharacterized protein n=1 Tax=Lacipirellula parvula TaxID=2650471 RepID=A0A5K7XFG2_9BACT|nr:hypothetical protein [Lacipirellula parvula]BBO31719.1 hypothetical protein PLANPX_1331 [Lacipirellula parvula]
MSQADETKEIESKEAVHGQKMIEVKLRFWTNDIAEEPGHILPKHAWCAGVVRMEANGSHGITPNNPRPFHTLMDVSSVIEQVLIDHGITLHLGRRAQKYLVDAPTRSGDAP